MREPRDQLPPMRWGDKPDLVGPRHHYRVALMARTLEAYLPPWVPSEASGGSLPRRQLSGPSPIDPSHARVASAAVRVLDAGAGRGTLALALTRRGYAVAALDASAGFLSRLARLRTRGAAATRLLQAARGDVTALPYGAGLFDAVVCGEVLEHVGDDAGAVVELARVLKPGGLLVATVPAGRDRYGPLDRWAGHRRRYERDELGVLVRAHGFTILRLHHWGFPLGRLYERLVQRPVLLRGARGGSTAAARRIGRGRLATRLIATAFRLDHLCDGVPWGPGLLLVARRDT